MEELFNFISEKYFIWFRDILDVFIVSYFVYRVLLLIRGTRAVQLLRGLMLLFFIYFVVNNILQLRTITWIMQTGATFVLFSLPIIFQPEFRRLLASLGKDSVLGENNNLFGGKILFDYKNIIMLSVKNMASQKTGALIIIERETGLNEFTEGGVPINATLSSELIESIFYTGTPLHDGALVIKNDIIVAASVVLPLSENIKPVKGKHHLGTRHRAGLGLSETSDAFCIIVSEETGNTSVALHGKLYKDVSDEKLEEMLLETLQSKNKKPTLNIKESIKNIGGKVKNKSNHEDKNNSTILEKIRDPNVGLKLTAFVMSFVFMFLLGKGTFYSSIEKTFILPLEIKYDKNLEKNNKKFQLNSNYIKLKLSGEKNNIEKLKPEEVNVFVNIDKIDNNQRVFVNVSVPNDVTIKEISPKEVLINTIN